MKTRFCLTLALLAGAACGGSLTVTPAPMPTFDLAHLFDEVRVPQLENRRFTHSTYWDAVSPFLGGGVKINAVGSSAEGRELRHLSYGTGPVAVLLWSQMHGDESTATMALADIIRFFHERPEHPLARRIAESATIHMIPLLNPDGAERFQRRNAQGIDVNRDARRLQTPEGRFLKAVRDSVEPDFGFNLHDQGASVRVGESDRGVAIALLAPAFNEARDVDAKRHRAMQVASVLVDAMTPLVGNHIAKYDDTFNPRAFGDLMGAWGASTILIESGGWKDDPQKQHLRKTNFVGLLSALDAISSGSYAAFDPSLYDNLEFNGRRLPDLLVTGGTVAVPGLPELKADLLINFERPLVREGGEFVEIGDLGTTEAQDTLRIDGLYIIPLPEALDEDGGLTTGAPSIFVVAEDSLGDRVRFRFEGKPPDGA